jgi:hypothetical protein
LPWLLALAATPVHRAAHPEGGSVNAKGRARAGSIIGGFSAWPHDCHKSENFTALSLPARALLLEFLGQLRKANNGDLCCAWALLRERGWRSRDTIERARAELEARGWIIRTRQGGRHRANLYGVTWRAIDDCNGKLDVSACPAPGSWKKQFAMPAKRATLGRQPSNNSPAVGQPPVHLARQAG